MEAPANTSCCQCGVHAARRPSGAPAPPLAQSKQMLTLAWITGQKCSSMAATTKAHPVEQRVAPAAAQAAVGAVPPGPARAAPLRQGGAVGASAELETSAQHTVASPFWLPPPTASRLSNVLFSRGPSGALDAFRADQHGPHMRRKVKERLETRCCSLFLGQHSISRPAWDRSSRLAGALRPPHSSFHQQCTAPQYARCQRPPPALAAAP